MPASAKAAHPSSHPQACSVTRRSGNTNAHHVEHMMTWTLNSHTNPINRSAKKELYQYASPLASTSSKPSIHREPMSQLQKRQPNLPDLTGQQFGSATVIGFHMWRRSAGNSLWAVQCGCGKFDTIVTRTIKLNVQLETRAKKGKRTYRPWVCTECHLKSRSAQIPQIPLHPS